ncbi:hypothetical protein [Vibrio neptunius]|uniref:Uncharacterized protein n=1 Tax=Vibrio neptunius TaxID=170651 RepID=A0ABS3A8H7_9VIBR|nr:hypothetical protein [Vibrio neptunius]MBN3495851.1 hypothetical protein [Vibrio neptunius]MBN3518263.1 hypothetical protein [Vibrio neptunius]MBN3552598.1 hypothetical protein [Vibrio neptunius]MBN3580663.1 hypothetical protein [Vibrio neptunius]MCH9874329.1 hypothetical protein [Vibrio neptunius]
MKRVSIAFFGIMLSAMAMASTTVQHEEQCKTQLNAALPTLKDIANGLTPAPTESVEKSKQAVLKAESYGEKGEYCKAYQALVAD